MTERLSAVRARVSGNEGTTAIEAIRAENQQLLRDGKRRCEACGLLYRLHVDNFHRNGRGGFRYVCRHCNNRKQREAYASNPDVRERANENSRRNYYLNHAARLEKQRQYRRKHLWHIRSYARAYYEDNRETILRERRKYRSQQADAMRVYRQRWKAERFAAVLARVQP